MFISQHSIVIIIIMVIIIIIITIIITTVLSCCGPDDATEFIILGHLSVCVCVCVSVCLSICLCVCLFVCVTYSSSFMPHWPEIRFLTEMLASLRVAENDLNNN